MSANVEGYRNESFESLEAAVLETSRGRWFLEEYAKRQRSSETLAILDIIRKLENTIGNTSFSPVSKPEEKINTEQLKFFKKDEEIFLEPKIVAPALSVVAPIANPNPEPLGVTKQPAEPRGAKLKIQRLSPAQQVEEPSIAAAPEVEVTTPAPVVAVPSEEAPAAEAKPRVIIIRRPASEAAEIPMMEDSSPEVAA